MLTAETARRQTDSARKPTSELFNIIESMSKSGNDFATIRTKELRDAEGSEKELIELGFKVTKDESYFTINW